MGKWSSNDRFTQVKAAKSWGVTWTVWKSLPHDDMMTMLAEYVASNEMDAYDAYQLEKKNRPKG